MMRVRSLASERTTPRTSVALGAKAATTLAAILLLTACGDKPAPVVSADTSCERFAHISANEAQRKVFSDNWTVMESYADQVIAHNIEYDRKCQGEAK